MSFAMNKHHHVRAKISIPQMVIMDIGINKVEVIKDLAEVLAAEIVSNLEIERETDIDSMNTHFTTSLVYVKPSDYRHIIDVIRNQNYNLVDKDGRIIPLSELL